MANKYDVFISYSHHNKRYVHAFAQRLREAGLSVWIDMYGIHSTEDFKCRIVEAISESTCFVFFSSRAANKSKYTVSEVGVAVELNKPILPIRLDKSRYASSILFDLVNIDYIDATDLELDAVVKRALYSLSIHLGRPLGEVVIAPERKKKSTLILYAIVLICLFAGVFLFILSQRNSVIEDAFDTVQSDDELLKEAQDDTVSSPIIIDGSDTPKTPETETYSYERQLEEAIKEGNWDIVKTLADEGYAPAYVPLAKHYLKSSSTHEQADYYARKAKASGYKKESNSIIETLKEYHFYD